MYAQMHDILKEELGPVIGRPCDESPVDTADQVHAFGRLLFFSEHAAGRPALTAPSRGRAPTGEDTRRSGHSLSGTAVLSAAHARAPSLSQNAMVDGSVCRS